MIPINEFNVSVIPQLLNYFVPGYLCIITYRNLTSSTTKSEHTLWVSCVISYLVTIFAKIFLPSCITSMPEYLALASCLITVIVTALLVKMLQSKWFSWLTAKLLHTNLAPTVFAAHVKVSHPGTTVRVYLKDKDFYVEGGLSNHSNDPEDPYISLKMYKFYKKSDAEPYYECDENDQFFIISLDNVEYIEMWPR